MVWSNWRGAGMVMLALSLGMVAQGQSAGQNPKSSASANLHYMTVHENGQSLRCRVIASWRLPDGSRAYQLQSLTTGDMLTVVEAGQSTLKAGDQGSLRPMRVFNWGKSTTPPPGVPVPPREVMQDPAFAQAAYSQAELLPVPSRPAPTRPASGAPETIIWWEEGKGSAMQPQGVIPAGASAPWDNVVPALVPQFEVTPATLEVVEGSVPVINLTSGTGPKPLPSGLRPMIELPPTIGNEMPSTKAGCCNPNARPWFRAGRTTALGTGVLTPKTTSVPPSAASQEIKQASATVVVEADPTLPMHQAMNRNTSGGFELRPAPLFGSSKRGTRQEPAKAPQTASPWRPSWPQRAETKINSNPSASAGLLPKLVPVARTEQVQQIPITPSASGVKPALVPLTEHQGIVLTQGKLPSGAPQVGAMPGPVTVPMESSQPSVFTRMWLGMKRPFGASEPAPASAHAKKTTPLQMTQGTPGLMPRTIYPATPAKTVAGSTPTVRKMSPHVVEVTERTPEPKVERPVQTVQAQVKKNGPTLVPPATPLQPKTEQGFFARWFGGSKTPAPQPVQVAQQTKPVFPPSQIKTVPAPTANPVQQAKASTNTTDPNAVTQAGGLPRTTPLDVKIPPGTKSTNPVAPTSVAQTQKPVQPPLFPSNKTGSTQPLPTQPVLPAPSTNPIAQQNPPANKNVWPWTKSPAPVQTAQNKTTTELPKLEGAKPEVVKPLVPSVVKTPGGTSDLPKPPIFPGSPTPPVTTPVPVQTAQNKMPTELPRLEGAKPMLPSVTPKSPTPSTLPSVVKNTPATPDLSKPPMFPGSTTPPNKPDTTQAAQGKFAFFNNLFGKKSGAQGGTTGVQPKSIDQPAGAMAVAQQKTVPSSPPTSKAPSKAPTGLAADLAPVPSTQAKAPTLQGKPGYLPEVIKTAAAKQPAAAPGSVTQAVASSKDFPRPPGSETTAAAKQSTTGNKSYPSSTAIPGTLNDGKVQTASNSTPAFSTATPNNKTTPPAKTSPATTSTANKTDLGDRTKGLTRPPVTVAQGAKKPVTTAPKTGPADRTSDLPRPPQIAVAQGATGLQPKTILPVTHLPSPSLPPSSNPGVQTAAASSGSNPTAAPTPIKTLPELKAPPVTAPRAIPGSQNPFDLKGPPATVQTAEARAPSINDLKAPPPAAIKPASASTKPLTSADYPVPPGGQKPRPLTTAQVAALSPNSTPPATEGKGKQGLIPFLFNWKGTRSEQVAQGPTPTLPRSIQDTPETKQTSVKGPEGSTLAKAPGSLSISDRGNKPNDLRGALQANAAANKDSKTGGFKNWFGSQQGSDIVKPAEPAPLDEKSFAANKSLPFPVAPEGTPIPPLAKASMTPAPASLAQNKTEPGRLPFSTASPNDTQSGLPSISRPGAPPTMADIKPVPAVAQAPAAEPVRPVVQAAIPPKRDWRNMWGKNDGSVAQASLPTSNSRPGLGDILMNPERFNPAQKPLPPEAGLLAYQKPQAPQAPIQTVAHNVQSAPQPTQPQAPQTPQAPNLPPHMMPGLPPGTQSVMAARNGMMTGVQYVPVPVVTIPEPVRPPTPPVPQMPEAPQPAMYVNAFTPPAQPNQGQPQKYGPGYPGQPGMSGPMMAPRMPLMNPALMAQAYAQNPFLANPMLLQQGIQQFALLTPAQQSLIHQALYIQQQSYMMQQQALYMQQQQAMMQPPHRPVLPMNYPANYQGPQAPNPFGAQQQQAAMPAQYMQPMGAPQQIQQAMAQMPPMMPTMPQGAPMQVAQQQPPTAQQLISVLIESPYPAQRETAAQALAAMNWRNNPQILHVLLQAARQDPAASVRAGCIFSLSRMNVATEPVMTTLQSLQNDPDPRVRQEVQQAYARLGTPRTNQ